VPSGGYTTVVLLSNATAAGSWDRHDQTPANVSWSTNTFDYPGSITSATWNGNVVAVNRGGTGASTASGARTNLGLGTIATQDSSAVAITGGTIDGTTVGGTTAAAGTFTTLTAQNETLKGTGQNFVLNSQLIGGSNWVNSGTATSTQNTAVAPDSTTTASTITSATDVTLGGNNVRTANTAVTSNTAYTYSIYLKLNSATTCSAVLRDSSSGNTYTVTQTSAGVWTRFSATFTTGANTTLINILLGNANGTFFAWGAQLELGSVLGTYIPTTTAAVYGTPTLSFSGVASIGLQSDGSLYETSAGTGSVKFYTNNIGQEQARIAHTASAVNYHNFTGSATGNAPVYSVAGSDAAVSLAIQSKGTGAIDLAAGSSGVNISNGGTVTAITRTAAGSAYTSPPSVSISAPTTAGGVQATATTLVQNNVVTPTITSGGTGYTAGDTLTLVGGTGTASTLTVSTVSSGVITAISTATQGAYSVVPTNPISVTGGTGSGATFTINSYGIYSIFTITNAGSGYVEQPTVTFSGGGGSGAAAYATVGGDVTIKSIGSSIILANPAGTMTKFVSTGGGSLVSYPELTGSQFSTVAYYGVNGTGGNIGLQIASKGTGSLTFQTSNVTQLFISNTTSAVNYVQVTGGVTGGRGVISAQGSDTTVSLGIYSKGGTTTYFSGNGGTTTAFQVNHTSSGVNWLQVAPSIAGSAPVFSVTGSDTNIALAFQSKGTGAIDLAAGSSGVNVSNGGTVTALTRTAAGVSYTSPPSVAISAPTTAGGVQATATSTVSLQTIAVNAGGSGYLVGDVLTLVGGTGTAATITVATLSGSAVATVNITSTGAYTVIPTNPISVTGGTGTSATFTASSYALSNTINITAAGSGYVEQPTVTFSGGGGSGAAAYATVGSQTIVKGLGTSVGTITNQSIMFQTPAGNSLLLRDPGQGPIDAHVMIVPTASGYAQVLAEGSNANASLYVGARGTGSIRFSTNSTGITEQMRVSATASAVNYHNFTGSATTFAPVYSVAGSDTNISMVMQPKGTGAIDLATGTNGIVNISNGGTVTGVGRTNTGTGYTSTPTWTASAPTTAGGTTASGTTNISNNVTTATITSGGTGYTVGDVLTFVGGTFTLASQVTVSAVSSGVITGTTTIVGGIYTVAPTNPISVTGGTGTGATFTLNSYGVNALQITNAGSGYVEQPTITFSGGGGGSGAAAYASVGSLPIIKSVLTALNFQTALGTAFALGSFGSSPNTNYLQTYASGSGNPVILQAAGFDAATEVVISSKSTGAIRFATNTYGVGTGVDQMRVSHIASAVNYVQVTGAATGGNVVISAQGSDANVNLQLNAKGTAGVFTQFYHTIGSGYANKILITGAATTVSPSIQATGTDTDIPLVLQPKGTGALQAQLTDSTATGGNARGANAVDWQTARASASQVASGQYSVVGGGYGNIASNFESAIFSGQLNTASSLAGAILGGQANAVTALAACIVGGVSNAATGTYNFIGGGYANSGTANAAVTTQSATMNGTTTVTLAATNANIKVGQYITGTSIASETYVAAISGTSLTLSKNASGSSTSTLSFLTPHGVVVGGGNNQATGAYSFIGGGGDAGTAANRNVASGDWSVVAGGKKNLASGQSSFIGAGGDYTSGVAGNTASGLASAVVAGFANSNGSYGGFLGAGSSNTISAVDYAVLVGGNNQTVNAGYSAILGGQWGTARSIVGNHVFPACNSPIAGAAGISQAALLVLGVQTTDATATVLRSNTSAASGTNQVILPNNSAYYFRGEVIAGVTGGGNTKGWYIEGVIKRGAGVGTTALVGTPTVTSNYADAGASTWTIAVTADTTNGGLAVTFTGQASTTIRCVAQIRTTEMTY
jgi:hypothetical protein